MFRDTVRQIGFRRLVGVSAKFFFAIMYMQLIGSDQR